MNYHTDWTKAGNCQSGGTGGECQIKELDVFTYTFLGHT